MNAELRRLIGERNFTSLEEVQAFLGQEMHRRNSAPNDDFHGFSPEEMHRVLHFPFESPGVAQFRTLPDAAAAGVPIVALVQIIIRAAGEKGLKATALGNLPRALCREAFVAHPSGHRMLLDLGAAGIHKEEDFFDFHVARIIAESAGLLKRNKGKFTLTAKGRKIADRPGALYDELLHAFIGNYNWAYGDAMSPLPFIRTSFLFTLYLLHRYGNEWRQGGFYFAQFFKAFPMVVGEASPRFGSPEKEVALAYPLRALSRFAVPFGLVEERPGANWRTENDEFRATPLLSQLVMFSSGSPA